MSFPPLAQIRPYPMEQAFHQVKNPQAKVADLWFRDDIQMIDVRAPVEVAQGSWPGAVNISLLNDLEREVVGILYKHQGQTVAIDKGYDLFAQKIDELKLRIQALPQDKQFCVTCARGGMRSGVFTAFLRQLGYDALQVEGGYKAFRNWTLKRLDEFVIPNLVVLQGPTGSAKTRLLQLLPNHIDLEGLAQHRGSMFGGIGLAPAKQKAFEADLLKALDALDLSQPVYFEGESRKIGPCCLPAPLYQQMRQARIFLIQCPLALRTQRTIEEYIQPYPQHFALVRRLIGSLNIDLGHAKARELLEEFDQGRYQECFGSILELYYDRKYQHSIKDMKIEAKIDSTDLIKAAQEVQAAARR